MDVDSPEQQAHSPKPQKSPVVRGARACTVCRAAKMKCVASIAGQPPCQRCLKSNTECVFEKHRRGRKPGSKLSEASKMLRRLEKGLNNAKLKSQLSEAELAQQELHNGDTSKNPHIRLAESSRNDALHFDMLPDGGEHRYHTQLSGSSSMDEDGDDAENGEEGMYPAKLIKRARQRNSFFGTVLGPSATRGAREGPATSLSPPGSARPAAYSPDGVDFARFSLSPTFDQVEDPIQMGLMDEALANNIRDLVMIRLNPFVNLFDPELHTTNYVRRKCAFLFTTLLMAGSKFFKPDLYPKIRQLAEKHAIRAFAEQKKSVEVVQAFMCMTYWKEPDDTRTWTYIGYACRMAVELDLNRFHPTPPVNETLLQRLERRNRERAYLVLFVHDRSLSMQTGRLYMLPEDEFVKESNAWHTQVPGDVPIRPEDVIVSAFVALRLIATETTKMFELQRGSVNNGQPDNYDFLLNVCNSKLANWMITWAGEMKKARGESFHHSFLEFFQLYVGLFLNSFGINAVANPNDPSPSMQASTTCYNNATRCLEIIVTEFARVQMLQYSQESITTMTAYCALMLLKLLRKFGRKGDEASSKLILSASDAYKEAGAMMPSSSSCVAHARFLRAVVEREDMKARASRGERASQSQSHSLKLPTYPPTSGSASPSLERHSQSQSNGDASLTNTAYPYPPYGTQQQQAMPLMSPPQGGPNAMTNGTAYPPAAAAFPNPAHGEQAYYNDLCRELGVSHAVDHAVDIVRETGLYNGLGHQQYSMMGT